jgi:glucose/arabinose dehydrogenase
VALPNGGAAVVSSKLSSAVCAVWMLVVGAVLLRAEPPQKRGDPVTETVQGNIVRPAQVEPTDDRVRQHVKVPAGFRLSKFADGLGNARMLAVHPETGGVYVTRREEGDVLLLRDADNDGRAEEKKTLARRPGMHGIAFHDGKVYLATVRDVFVADVKPDGTFGDLRQIISDLPDGGQHPNRTLAVGPDQMLYVSVGSSSNSADEPNPEHATILRCTLDGKNRSVYASGLRNTIGFGWHPTTKQLWGMDHGIDWLGDDEQKEELNLVEESKDYGWPFVFADGKVNPQREPPPGKTTEQLKRESTNAVLLYTAHAAPMQMAFCTGDALGADHRGDAFVAMRGSWNRSPPSGYEVARIDFDDGGKPLKIEPFVTGWLVDDGGGKWSHLGRLAGCAFAIDGSLLVSDDANGVIYRITPARGEAASGRD